MESVRAPKECFLIDQSTGSFHIIIEGLFFSAFSSFRGVAVLFFFFSHICMIMMDTHC